MKVPVMLLAAGRGERMRPLTDAMPKPLLQVRGRPLLHWLLQALAQGGASRAVNNTAWLGEQIEAAFGSAFAPAQTPAPLPIRYSHEGRDFGAALETAGGIARALPLLCPPDFAFSPAAVARFAASDKLAHIWLVPNPPHVPRGDFGLSLACGSGIGLALNLPADDAQPRYTYSTIGLYRKALFEAPWCDIAAGNPHGVKAPLAPLMRKAMDNGLVSAELYGGAWTDVGTPRRLAQLNHPISMDAA